jgi:hypothetical protein
VAVKETLSLEKIASQGEIHASLEKITPQEKMPSQGETCPLGKEALHLFLY